MHNDGTHLLPDAASSAFMPRRVLTVVFRRKRLIAVAFLVVFLPVFLAVLLLPAEYEGQTRILVSRQRLDPVISSNFTRESASGGGRLEQQDIDSEIDLLRSEDLLRRVVLAAGLVEPESAWPRLLPWAPRTEEERIAVAVRELRQELTIAPPNRSNLVTVRYYSDDPHKAARVLQVLADLYLEKHLQVHRPAGASEFFQEEVERNRLALEEAERALVAFTQREGVVSAQAEDAALLGKITDMDASLQETGAQIAATQTRLRDIEKQLEAASPRVTTAVRTSTALLESLKSSLHALELKRAELLTKFQPSYRLVRDLDVQIADTRASIARAEQAPSAERTTDLDPVYAWLSSERAKARAELVALRANAAQTRRSLQEFRGRAVRLRQLEKEQQELQRVADSANETYVGALRKQAEARMSEALDRSRIMNVAIAEPATVPAVPVVSAGFRLGMGFMLALLAAFGLAFLVDYWDPSFRAPYEVEEALAIPVLSAIPQVSRSLPHRTVKRLAG